MRTGPTDDRHASVMFVDRIRRSPVRTALVVLGEDEISYEALGVRLAATVHALRAAGVEQGDRVAFAASNRTEVIEVMAATLHLGGIFVPLNTRLSAAELRFITLDAGAKVILADSAMATLLAPERAALGVDHALRLPDVAAVQDEIGRAHVCTPATNAHLVCH